MRSAYYLPKCQLQEIPKCTFLLYSGFLCGNQACACIAVVFWVALRGNFGCNKSPFGHIKNYKRGSCKKKPAAPPLHFPGPARAPCGLKKKAAVPPPGANRDAAPTAAWAALTLPRWGKGGHPPLPPTGVPISKSRSPTALPLQCLPLFPEMRYQPLHLQGPNGNPHRANPPQVKEKWFHFLVK